MTSNSINFDVDKAINWFKKAAELDNYTALFNLGCIYKDGIGVTKDHVLAFNYFEKAAEHDEADALYELADCYLNGIGTKPNIKKARALFARSADMGNEKALSILGNLK